MSAQTPPSPEARSGAAFPDIPTTYCAYTAIADVNERHPDEIDQLAYQTVKAGGFKVISVGGSHYEGDLSRSAATNAAGDPTFPARATRA